MLKRPVPSWFVVVGKDINKWFELIVKKWGRGRFAK
jgi:hypothetical protein